MARQRARKIPKPPRDPQEQAQAEASTMPPEQSAHAAGSVGPPPVPGGQATRGEEWTPANTTTGQATSTQTGDLKTFGEGRGIAGATSEGLGNPVAERRAGGRPRDTEDDSAA